MTTPIVPLLAYSLELSVAANNGVSYVCVGESATLTLSVSNPGETVTLDSLALIFSLGTNATDLTTATSAITPSVPSGWTTAWTNTGLLLTPPNGSVSVTPTTGLTFVLTVSPVNAIVGTTSVALIETTASQTAYPPPFSIPKMPAGFVLSGLVAAPAQIAPGGTVTLTWNGTPNQPYTVNYFGGPAAGVTVTAPASGTVAWTSPAVQTTSSSEVFTVSATVQSATVQASAVVIVAVPQIESFPQPQEYYGEPVGLVWSTLNATSCQLWSQGTQIDAAAPANPPVGGYLVTPTAHLTPYTLYACNGGAQSAAQTIEVRVRQWALSGTPLDFGDATPACSLVITSDGGTLFVQGQRLSMIGTATLSVVRQTSIVTNQTPAANTLALAPNASVLYVALNFGGQGPRLAPVSFSAASFASSTDWMELFYQAGAYPDDNFGQILVITTDGGTLYTGFNQIQQVFGISAPPTVTQYTGLPANPVTQGSCVTPLPASDVGTCGGSTLSLQLSPDNTTLYGVMALTSPPASSGLPSLGLYAMPTASFTTATLITAVTAPCFALSTDGSAVYCAGPATSAGGLTVCALQSSTSGYTPQWTGVVCTLPSSATATLVGLATEPSGGIFAVVMIDGLTGTAENPVGNGLNVFILNPVTGTATFLYYQDIPAGQVTFAAMVSDATGANLYLAAGGYLVHFVRTIPAPAST